MYEEIENQDLFEEGEELRLFTFGHFQLSSIQQGIQALHATAELFIEYVPFVGMKELRAKQVNMLHTWATDWKTVVCKCAGNSAALEETIGTLDTFPYPWSYFEESEEAMEGITTAAAVVLPARIFDTGVKLRKSRDVSQSVIKHPNGTSILFKDSAGDDVGEYTDLELELIDLLVNTRLAS